MTTWDSIKNSKIPRIAGIVLATVLVVYLWLMGYFSSIFYLFGLYAAIYLVSLLFRTSKIVGFIIGAGAILLYAQAIISGLAILYITLHYMFSGHIIIGLLLVFLEFLFGWTLLLILQFAIGFMFGAPLFWFQSDLEKRFGGN